MNHSRQLPDSEPAPREPAFNLPAVVVAVIAGLSLIYFFQWLIGDEREIELMQALALVPARVSIALDIATIDTVVAAARAATAPENLRQAGLLIGFFVRDQDAHWWSLGTHALLHGSALHLGMNCIWLAVFGSPVARRFGAPGFMALLAIGAVAGAVAHLASRPLDYAPMIGASGAVAALTGAAARFVFSRGFRADALADDVAVRMMPALSLVGLVQNRQALAFVLIWFVTNWLFGSGIAPIAGVDQDVAWEAHVGGFLAGLLLFGLFDRGRLLVREL